MPDLELQELETSPVGDYGVNCFIRKSFSGSNGCKLHWHNSLEIFHLISGSLVLSIGNSTYTLKPGDTAVVNSGELHRSLRFIDNTRHICMKIPRSLIDSSGIDLYHTEYISPLFSGRITINSKIEGDRELQFCFGKILKCLSDKPRGWELLYKSFVFRILSVLLGTYSNKKEQYLACKYDYDVIKKTVDYINSGYVNRLTLKSLAAYSGYSPAHLCRKFKQICGCSPIEYLNIVRCANAARLIERTAHNITEISAKSGFSDPNYFSRVFKKVYDITPTEYKAQNNKLTK
ncbi:MAG: HTH-type transcriptional activator Btr [Firmicutes bacterium ADurb.Bin193]|nr:MAG: HTH-type transcriptional activator Btr [Firmicutes bacterium ADurb.Bin193]